jgi:hypothetical protein
MDDAGLEREFGERLIPEGFTKKGSRILHGKEQRMRHYRSIVVDFRIYEASTVQSVLTPGHARWVGSVRVKATLLVPPRSRLRNLIAGFLFIFNLFAPTTTTTTKHSTCRRRYRSTDGIILSSILFYIRRRPPRSTPCPRHGWNKQNQQWGEQVGGH